MTPISLRDLYVVSSARGYASEWLLSSETGELNPEIRVVSLSPALNLLHARLISLLCRLTAKSPSCASSKALVPHVQSPLSAGEVRFPAMPQPVETVLAKSCILFSSALHSEGEI
jgi:hypothetical protein